jgi:hypothetical protein
MSHWASYMQYRCGHRSNVHWAHGSSCTACLNCYPILTWNRIEKCPKCEAAEERRQGEKKRAADAEMEKERKQKEEKAAREAERAKQRNEYERRKWEQYLAKKDQK